MLNKNSFIRYLLSFRSALAALFLAVLVTKPAPLKAEMQTEPVRKTHQQSVVANARSDIAQEPQPPQPIMVEVRELKGNVVYGPSGQPVTLGQRLQAGGGELITGDNSSVRLFINDHIGSVEVSEKTRLTIKTLSNGNTSFFVSVGKVRLSVGKTSNDLYSGNQPLQGSEKSLLAQSRSGRTYPLSIETPAGIAGVQGTSFGVNVGPDGKTGISTLQGSVAALAKGQVVLVNPGQYVVISPGDAPTPVQKTPPRAKFNSLHVRRVSGNAVRVVGQVDPLDLVFINGRAIETEPDGRFSTLVERPLSRRLKFVIRGPEVRETFYEIAVN